MSKYGDGKMIRYNLCEICSHAHLFYSANGIILCPFPTETSGYLCLSLQSLVPGSFTSFTKWHRRSDRMKRRQVFLFLAVDALLFQVLGITNAKKTISCDFQKEQKKKEDPAGRAKTFRPEPSGSSRDSTGTQPSSKSGPHSNQPGSHGHHREQYNPANKRHFGNDGTC